MTGASQIDYHIGRDDENIHHSWNNSHEPVLTVESGTTIEFDCLDGTAGQVTPSTTAADLADVDTGLVHPLTGPVAIEGAQPGDVLQVDLHGMDHDGWGWTAFGFDADSFGLLGEEFDEPALHIWELDDTHAFFVDGIQVPIDPFPGNLGVAPAADGAHSTYPPRDVGGNMDIQYLTEGSTVYFPVENEGALFSIGDGHATQGDGEVCQTALETPLSITAELTPRPDMSIEQPELETDHPYTPHARQEPMYATTGISDDLMAATKQAVSHMLDHLEGEHGLARSEAYILCSVAVDLKINQVVAAPNWTVTAHLSKDLFPS